MTRQSIFSLTDILTVSKRYMLSVGYSAGLRWCNIDLWWGFIIPNVRKLKWFCHEWKYYGKKTVWKIVSYHI